MKKVLLFFAVLMMASTGMWAETQNVSYSYPVYDTADDPTSGIKEWKTASVDATVVTDASEPVTWGTAGTATWYVVTGTDVTLSQGAICQGDVHLILADGAKLTATVVDKHASIELSGEGNSLTIYGQSTAPETIGQLMVTSEWLGAGIGGGDESYGSNITINGGYVTATGDMGAGIGGGNGGSGSNITINGGTVKANSSNGAGIGDGGSASGSHITINGGTVTANSGTGAGIGGGYKGFGSNITINGGNVTATSGMGDGIGNGHDATGSSSNIFVATRCILKEVNIVGGEEHTTEIAPDRTSKTDIAADLAGKKHVTVETDPSFAYVAYIDEKGEEQHVYAKPITSSDSQVTWRDDWYIVTGANVTLSKGAICQTDVHLILADGAKLTASGIGGDTFFDDTAGIKVSGEGNSLTIYGQTAQSGKLEANGGGMASAGIGGGYMGSGSNITINGGYVTATGAHGAGIGGGMRGSGTNITINGGYVTATGVHGAGIGGGANCPGSHITINGGTVKANSTSGAGIGGGANCPGSNITINGGNVTATSVTGDGIGNGLDATGSSSNIRVTPTLYVTADDNNPPTKAIANDGGDIAESLAGKAYVTITDLAGNAYAEGKADALGTLGNEQEGPALIVTDQDGKEVILYNPTSVKYIMK